ncbi:HEAT repeat domain-containing protein [Candidatus Palauibacter sp.]|uniref:HEAT repeat domain-containing protein n=1 Tax=Candidatus Palauibacter sp. TaxID=3101350 RepID=UPI003B026F46
MNSPKRKLMAIGLALLGVTAVNAATPTGSLPVLGVGALAAQEREAVASPRNAREEGTMFLEARRAMNAEDFERAAELFAAIRTSRVSSLYSRYVPDAYYWEAFARYRQGDLEEARILLETVMVGHSEAQSHGRLYADVRNLHLEIQSQLASGGDADALEQVLRDAEATLDPSPTRAAFRVMPMEVGGRMVSLPVRVADLEAHADSVAADSAHVEARADWMISELYSRADTMLAEGNAGADATVAEANARVDELAAALRGQASSTGQVQEYVRQAAERQLEALQAAEYGRQAVEYERLAAEYELQAAEYDWQRAEYQEAARIQEQGQEACEDVSVQLAALGAVMRYDEVTRMQVLRDVLAREDACSMRLHEEAVGLVGRQGTDEAEDVLLRVIETHSERSVRRAALQELWRFDSTDAFTRLQSTLRDSDDDALKGDAIEGLRRSRFEAGATAIQNALVGAAIDRSNDYGVRRSAIYALRLRDHVEAGVFIPIYERIESEDLKEYLLSQMAMKVRAKEDMETAAWARSVAFNPEESSGVRSEAFSAWAAHPTVTVVYLRNLYGELTEAFLKRQAIYAIYQRTESDASVPAVLMELIRNETDEEVRERGIYWLGRTESEDAVDFLLELLRPPASDTTLRRPG